MAWLTDGWPDSAGSHVEQNMLVSGVTAERDRPCRRFHAMRWTPPLMRGTFKLRGIYRPAT